MLLLAAIFLVLLAALLWPGNPASRAAIAVTGSIRSTLGGASA